jgi:hypothetical protein
MLPKEVTVSTELFLKAAYPISINDGAYTSFIPDDKNSPSDIFVA